MGCFGLCLRQSIRKMVSKQLSICCIWNLRLLRGNETMCVHFSNSYRTDKQLNYAGYIPYVKTIQLSVRKLPSAIRSFRFFGICTNSYLWKIRLFNLVLFCFGHIEKGRVGVSSNWGIAGFWG